VGSGSGYRAEKLGFAAARRADEERWAARRGGGLRLADEEWDMERTGTWTII